MSILNALYPQGDFLNIRANAPTQADYNIRATEDLVRNLPGGVLRDILAPAAAATLSLPYDTIQGISRAKSFTPSGIMQAIDRENPLSSAYERFMGASAPLAERISNLDLLGNFGFGTPAAASEVSIEEPSATSDMGYIGTSGTADDFFGSGFSATSDMGYPSVTRGGPQTFQDFYESTYESYDPEKDDEQVDYLPGQSSLKDKISGFAKNIIGQPGISSLIGFINPVAGLVSRGLGYLGRNLSPSFVGPKGARGYGSESVGGLFARSNTLADFVQNVRDKRARDAAAARGAAKQAEQARMNAFRAIRDSQPSGGGGGGGIGSSYGGSASPGSQRPGGSDAMGSF